MTGESRNMRFVITGCSGGGKSTLLAELARRGHNVMPEPGRIIVREELAGDASGLPWVNIGKFAERAILMGMEFHAAAALKTDAVFFDRCIIDAVAACERLEIPLPSSFADATAHYRYAQRAFIAPPWPELFEQDEERQSSFEEALAEYEHLCAFYPKLGYALVELPKASVGARAAFVERTFRGS